MPSKIGNGTGSTLRIITSDKYYLLYLGRHVCSRQKARPGVRHLLPTNKTGLIRVDDEFKLALSITTTQVVFTYAVADDAPRTTVGQDTELNGKRVYFSLINYPQVAFFAAKWSGPCAHEHPLPLAAVARNCPLAGSTEPIGSSRGGGSILLSWASPACLPLLGLVHDVNLNSRPPSRPNDEKSRQEAAK